MFIVWRCNYTSSYIKVDLCAHTDSKNGIFTAEYIPPTFSTRTPSPFCAGWRWGLLSRKNFFDFIFFRFSYSISTRILFFLFFWFSLVSLRSLDWNYFFEFYTRYSYLEIFFIFSDFVIVLVWFWLSDYRLIVSIFNLLVLTRLIFARYSLSVLRCIFLVFVSSCFSIVDSMLYLFCLL